MTRLYRYQGPPAIAQAVTGHPEGYPIRSVDDVEHWILQTACEKIASVYAEVVGYDKIVNPTR